MSHLAKETFICEVEVLRSEMESSELVIEGEFASEADMADWGFSEYLVSTNKTGYQLEPCTAVIILLVLYYNTLRLSIIPGSGSRL